MAGGRGGRPPKPTSLKVLNGNPGRRPLNKKEPKPKKGIPPCPQYLNTEARKEWKRISKQLFDLGLLTEIDRTALASYCIAFERWQHAEAKITSENLVMVTKTGYPIQNPYLCIANKAMEQMKGWLSEFGMTPSSRSRVTSSKEEETDPMEAFLNRAKKNKNKD